MIDDSAPAIRERPPRGAAGLPCPCCGAHASACETVAQARAHPLRSPTDPLIAQANRARDAVAKERIERG